MILSEMRPNAIIENASTLGFRDIDVNHDWVGDVRRRCSYLDLADTSDFIRQARELGLVNDDTVSNHLMDYQTLNEKQMKVFKQIESHYSDLITNSTHHEPLRLIVMGTAGTGKSYLINMIRIRLCEIARSHDVNAESPIVVLAPTGVAAFNIRGTTIHSTLSIPVSSKTFDLNGESLKKLQNRLKGISYFIIDEKSMVGRRMLAIIDIRLRQAFPEQRNQVFGGRSLILVGDFGQLPPVLDEPMYSQIPRCDPLSSDGIVAYSQFCEVYKLDIIQRQSGDSEEQCNFRSLLLCLRNGESTEDDWKLLATRFSDSPKVLSLDRDRFLKATCIIPRRSDVDEFNMNKLASLNCPVAAINAVHTGGSEARKADFDVAKGLQACLLLAKGAKVMLRTNLWTEAGLVNGSVGTVEEIVFDENQGLPSLPNAVLIEFNNYSGPAVVTTEGKKLVPIIPVRHTWKGKKGPCSRLQIPICLAWAITVHKSQGLTMQEATIDLGKKEFAAGLSFVAISRVCALENIIFSPFSLERLQRVKTSKRLQERLVEERRLFSMISQND